MHYVDEGAGSPILMVHGNPTWSFYFRELIQAFRDKHRVVVPDHIGCGLSDKPGRYPYTLATHIENLERLVDELDLRDVTLIVHDWGGAIGCGWAVRHPERVRRIVVLNTAAWVSSRVPWMLRLIHVPPVGSLLVRSGLNGFCRGALRFAAKRRDRMTRPVRAGYLLPYDSFSNRVAVLRFVQDIPIRQDSPSRAVLEDLDQRLPTLRDKPMLICWGGKDFVFTDHFLDGWRERFPEARVHRFADAGHYVLEDAGAEIRMLVRDFLQG
jgi:pimeloyl-ACP methyl ester carboxylesterase